MSEQSLTITVDHQIKLEASLIQGNSSKAAVICHPHPLYGGRMDNNVVLAVQAVFQKHGWSTARFNFRGVGESSGEYAEGIGEREDLKAVCRFLRDQPERLHTLCVVGYSFGAWVTLGAVQEGLDVDGLVLVSPPLDLMPFHDLRLPPVQSLITLGERDDFCRVASLQAWLKEQAGTFPEPRITTFPGVDHFYWGKEGLLQAEIEGFLVGGA
jgi:alpha/beta superfamily hydrolase